MFTKLAPKARGGVDYSFTKRLATPRETSPSCVTTHNDKLSLAQPVRSTAVHPPPHPPPTHSPTGLILACPTQASPLGTSVSSFNSGSTPLVQGNAFANTVASLDAMPDDVLLLIVATCGERYIALPELEAVNALGCLCRSVAEQLCRLQPLVGVQVRSLVIAPRLASRIARRWRITLLYQGELTAAVVEQGFIGRVRAIDARGTKRLAPTVARRVVPGLLATGCSQFELELSHVELNGTWESIFGEMAVASEVLCGLQLCGCRLRGPLPELRLPALQVLGLNANQLTGGLGPLRGCTALQKLFLAGNQLTGGIEALEGCKNLQKLFLYNNQLSGGLEPLRGCVAIQELFLAGNQLSGDLEPLRCCTKLKKLYLSNNQLSGPLEPLRGCTALHELFLDNNRFTGGLEPLQDSTALRELFVSNNQLSGGLEPIRGCTLLQELFLGDNQLTGDLEPISGCTRMEVLSLDDNHLTGGLDPLKFCKGVRTLYLAGNHLSGGLDPLKGCTALQKVYIANNQLSGGLEPLRCCTGLKELFLANNHLTGGLEPLQSCPALQELFLDDNQLSGGIEHLKSCTLLRTLNLSKNQLTATEKDKAHFQKQCVLFAHELLAPVPPPRRRSLQRVPRRLHRFSLGVAAAITPVLAWFVTSNLPA